MSSSFVLDQTKPYCRYFEEFSAIPRGSGHEKAMSDYLMAFAKEHGLRAVQDDMFNVVIYKDATDGKDDVVMLQAHMDMVWEKDQNIDFRFETDPLKLQVNDGWLSATGTTLGADDGAGVAYMMAILADENLKHPSLECVFTVQEETGLDGAKTIDPALLHAKYLINLDHGGDNSTCTSNSGGMRCTAHVPYTYVVNNAPCYEVSVSDGQGGHSGGLITKNRVNANKMLGRVLHELKLVALDLRIVSVSGGAKDNAIPRDAKAVISTAVDIRAVIERCQKEVRIEYADSDPDVVISYKSTDISDKAMSLKNTDNLISFMYLALNGLQALSQVIEGLPICSLNMGIVTMEDEDVIIHFSLRSPIESARRHMEQQLIALGRLCDTTITTDSEYPGWKYEPDSVIRGILRTALKEVRGLDLVEEATHGGLETGIFKSYLPDLDIITMGPNMLDIHTPRERLDLHSFDECYKVLTRVLELI